MKVWLSKRLELIHPLSADPELHQARLLIALGEFVICHVPERLAPELKYEIALRPAALHIHQHVISAIAPLGHFIKTTSPSPLLKFGFLNALYSYVYVVHERFAPELKYEIVLRFDSN